MQLIIYENESVSMSETKDGYTHVRILRDGQPRLTVDTRSSAIAFVKDGE